MIIDGGGTKASEPSGEEAVIVDVFGNIDDGIDIDGSGGHFVQNLKILERLWP